jgi:hypothetical protein
MHFINRAPVLNVTLMYLDDSEMAQMGNDHILSAANIIF